MIFEKQFSCKGQQLWRQKSWPNRFQDVKTWLKKQKQNMYQPKLLDYTIVNKIRKQDQKKCVKYKRYVRGYNSRFQTWIPSDAHVVSCMGQIWWQWIDFLKKLTCSYFFYNYICISWVFRLFPGFMVTPFIGIYRERERDWVLYIFTTGLLQGTTWIYTLMVLNDNYGTFEGLSQATIFQLYFAPLFQIKNHLNKFSQYFQGRYIAKRGANTL